MSLPKSIKRFCLWFAFGCICAVASTSQAEDIKIGDFKLTKSTGFVVLNAREKSPYVIVCVDNAKKLPLHVDRIRAWMIMDNGEIMLPQDRHPSQGNSLIYSGNDDGRTEQITFIFKNFGKPNPQISAVLLQFYDQYQVFDVPTDGKSSQN